MPVQYQTTEAESSPNGVSSHEVHNAPSSAQEKPVIGYAASTPLLADRVLKEIVTPEHKINPFRFQDYTGKVREQVAALHVWQFQPVDALVLNPPSHDGSTKAIARDVYHRLLVRFATRNIYQRIVAALFVLFFADTFLYLFMQRVVWNIVRARSEYDYSAAANAVPMAHFFHGLLMVPVAVLIYFAIPLLMKGVITKDIQADAQGIVRRCFLREVPRHTPPDLEDVWRHGWITSKAEPISAELTDTDATSLAAVQCVGDFAILVGAVLFAGFFTPVAFVVALVLFLITRKPDNLVRAQQIESQRAVEGSLYIAAGGRNWARLQEEARQRQMYEAIRDKSTRFDLGETTGILAARGDLYAPSSNMRFSLSLNDLQNHLLILGGTGSGKTSGVLRPLAQQLAAAPVGMVVMDGKAALPKELAALPGMTVIDPINTAVSLVGGLGPTEVIDTIAELLGGKGGEDGFWRDSAAAMLRRAAIMGHAAGGDWWTLYGISQIVTSVQARGAVSEIIQSKYSANYPPELLEAGTYFAEEWNNLEERTRSNILAVAQTWLATINGHPDLFKWAQTREDMETIDLTLPLRGGRIGLLIPGYRYGRAGAVVTALLKARIYARLKSRADQGWEEGGTPIVFLIDEAQEVATSEDATMLAIGRSLGLAMVAATQTIEGVEDTLGHATAAKWFAIFGGLIALPGRSMPTNNFIANRVGLSWMASIHSVLGTPLRETMQSEVISGMMAAGRNQSSLADAVREGVAKKIRGAKAALMTAHQPTEPTSHIGTNEVVNTGEINTLLAMPDTALAVVTCARVLRRDVIRLDPVYEV